MNIPFGDKPRVDHEANGFYVERTHASQKQRYGDTFYEYTIKSFQFHTDAEVEKYCVENVHKCTLTHKVYLKELRAGLEDFGDHFRLNYSLRKIKDGEYFYQVISPSTH